MTNDDPRIALGEAWLAPAEPVVAGAYGVWTLTYRAGRRGIAVGGRLAVAWRWPSDWERPQFDNPAAAGYTTLRSSGRCRLTGSFHRDIALHPWDHVITLTVADAPLRPGELTTLRLGDRGQGGPGMRAQTFQERVCEFHVLVDPDAAGRLLPLPESPALRVVGGPAHRLVLTGPTDVVVGEPFAVNLRVEDRWHNPALGYRGRVELRLAPAGAGMTYGFREEDGGVARLPASLDRPGVYRPVVTDDEGRSAAGNPIICHTAPPRYRRFWGDPHSGQSGAGCGAGSVGEHFHHLRDVAAVDFGTHQGNCFMLSAEDWAETCRVTRAFNQPGEFVAFLGYEWSGESAVGGDHNVIFLDDDQPIRRCSHALVPDRSDVDTDLPHIEDVYAHYAGRRVILVPHVGGRPSDLTYHDPELEPIVEIHSGHGTNEWFLAEALARGYRVGVTSGSDDVMGRPGANYPGLADGRNTRGGLTAVYATELTREALFEALKARRTYATTGERIALWVEADGHPLGSAYSTAAPPRIHCDVWSQASLERLDLYRGADLIYAAPVVDWSARQARTLRVSWTGAAARGTGPHSKLIWDGELVIEGGTIGNVRSYGFEGESDAILATGDHHVRWRSVTALDHDGIIFAYDAPEDARITFRSPVTTFSFRPADIGDDSFTVEAGPVDRRVTIVRPPAQPGPRQFSFDFTDDQCPPGTSAYYVRVVQDDDEKAWSSPIYVSR